MMSRSRGVVPLFAPQQKVARDGPRWGLAPSASYRSYRSGHADFLYPACPGLLTPRHELAAQLGGGARAQLSQEV
jgi:hypothetical protein